MNKPPAAPMPVPRNIFPAALVNARLWLEKFIVMPPMLVNTAVPPLATFKTLAVPLPRVSAPPAKFQVTLLPTVTVLLEPPAPMVKPPKMVALVTVIRL